MDSGAHDKTDDFVLDEMVCFDALVTCIALWKSALSLLIVC